MTVGAPADPYLDLSVRDFLAAVAAAEPTPGGGAVAAVSAGLAAGLVAMAAGFSTGQLSDAEAVRAAAEELRARAAPLARLDAEAYSAVLAAYRVPKDDPDRGAKIATALSAAADVPLEIALVARSVAELATRLEAEGNPNLRGDAVTARLLGMAAAGSAATLVALNLRDPADPRRERARQLADSP